RRLHEMGSITDHAVVAHPDCADGAICILATSQPDRVGIVKNDHSLMHVERPAVIAGQPRHVRRVLDKQHVYPTFFHGATHLGQATGVLVSREWQVCGGHQPPPENFSYLNLMCTSMQKESNKHTLIGRSYQKTVDTGDLSRNVVHNTRKK